MEANWALARKRERLEQRARIVQTIRAFFVDRAFLEVETPHLLPGNAPEAQIEPVPAAGGYLHTSPELCMKRLLAAGYPRLFQICRCWRAAERGRRHLPEYTMLEWYREGCDYHALMADCEALFAALVPTERLCWQGREIDLTPPWERLTVRQAFARYADVDLDRALAAGTFDEVIALQIEPQLGQGRPIFLTEYPAACAALARTKPGDPAVAERFELYVAGLELANAFSELTDPAEQRQRFIAEQEEQRRNGKAPAPLPVKFLDELGNIASAAGIALGVDRLVMLLGDAASIDEVVAFVPEDL